MKYHVEEIKKSAYSSIYRVVDENGNQRGEDFLDSLRAEWTAEDLTNGKKLPSELTEEEAWNLTNDILGEIEEARETGKPLPTYEEKVIPVPERVDDITISGQNEVGAIIEYRGEQWIVTSCYEEDGIEPATIRDEMDEVPPAGWYSQLFRVRDNQKAMQLVSDLIKAGKAQFTGPSTVKFPDEEYVHNLRDLRYSKEFGLYDKTRLSV